MLLVGNSLNSLQPGHLPDRPRAPLEERPFWLVPTCELTAHWVFLSCAQTVESHEHIDFAAAIVHGCHSHILLVTCYFTDSQGASALNLTKLARLGALVCTMNLPYVIVGDFNMTPDELVATQWIDQTPWSENVIPHETVSTCSNGGRMIDYAVISLVLAKNGGIDSVDVGRSFCTTTAAYV